MTMFAIQKYIKNRVKEAKTKEKKSLKLDAAKKLFISKRKLYSKTSET